MSVFKKKNSSRPTFISFVMGSGEKDEKQQENTLTFRPDNKSKETTSINTSPYSQSTDKSNNIIFLPDEVQVHETHHVIKYLPFSGGSSGVFGSILITTFRIIFISLTEEEKIPTRKHSFLKSDDIVFTNIVDIYQVGKNKRRKVSGMGHVVGNMKKLEIFCKDFRVHSFSLENTDNISVKKLLKVLVLFASQRNQDTTFSSILSYLSTERPYLSSYINQASYWVEDLTLFKAKCFRVSNCNKNFQYSESFPEFLAVPNSLSDQMIHSHLQNKNLFLLPVWSYTHNNGCSLVRMGLHKNNDNDKFFMDSLMSSLSHESSSPRIKLIDLIAGFHDIPSLQALQDSYSSLRDLFMTVSCKELWTNDSVFMSSLEASHWLNFISSFLLAAHSVAQCIVQGENVILRESPEKVYTPLIGSLVQVILQQKYRGLEGFERLLEREWVSLGFHFCDRLAFVKSPVRIQSPIFQVFLDCCWQLWQQNPFNFGFSPIYLTTLHDFAVQGFHDNFMFNSPKQRKSYYENKKELKKYSYESSQNLDSAPLSFFSSSTSPPSSSALKSIKQHNHNPHNNNTTNMHFKSFIKKNNIINNININNDNNSLNNEIGKNINNNSKGNNERLSEILNWKSHLEESWILQFLSPLPGSTLLFDFFNQNNKFLAPQHTHMSENEYGFNKNISSSENVNNSIEEINTNNNNNNIYTKCYKNFNISKNYPIDTKKLSPFYFSNIIDSFNVSCYYGSQNKVNIRNDFVLDVNWSVVQLKLWDHCYLRWLSPLEVLGGGHVVDYLNEVHLVTEVERLNNLINRLNMKLKEDEEKCQLKGFLLHKDQNSKKLKNCSEIDLDSLMLNDEEELNESCINLNSSKKIFSISLYSSSYPYDVPRLPFAFLPPPSNSFSDNPRASMADSDFASLEDNMSVSYISSFY